MADVELNVGPRLGGQRVATIVPNDGYSVDFLRSVDIQTKIDIDEKFKLLINTDWHCNTIAYVVIESILNALYVDMFQNKASRAYLNFYDIFSVRVSTKKNNNAEKEGNINISFEPGPKAEALITTEISKDRAQVEQIAAKDYFVITSEDMDEAELSAVNQAYFMIDRKACHSLSNNFGIAIPDSIPMTTFAVCETFIMNIFTRLLQQLGEDPTKELASVNFNDIIEFHAMRKDEDVILTMRPGLSAKLLIKSDETTEDEDSIPWYST